MFILADRLQKMSNVKSRCLAGFSPRKKGELRGKRL